MPFPVSSTLQGRLSVPPAEAARSLTLALTGLGASDVKAGEDEVTFRVPVTAGRPQSSVDSGRCLLEADGADGTSVSVELNFHRTATILAVVIVLWLGAMARYVLDVTDPGELVFFLVLGFLWLHGFSYGVARWWYRRELGLE